MRVTMSARVHTDGNTNSATLYIPPFNTDTTAPDPLHPSLLPNICSDSAVSLNACVSAVAAEKHRTSLKPASRLAADLNPGTLLLRVLIAIPRIVRNCVLPSFDLTHPGCVLHPDMSARITNKLLLFRDAGAFISWGADKRYKHSVASLWVCFLPWGCCLPWVVVCL